MVRNEDLVQRSRQSVPKIFEDQVRRTPGAAAILSGEAVITYDALNRRANQIAHELIARGVGIEVPVGVYMPRCPEAIIAILGILKAGGAYVPVDPAYPEERKRFIIENSGMSMVLVKGRDTDGGLPAFPVPVLGVYDQILSQKEEFDPVRPGDGDDPHRLLYILYTSGSTGVPKGVHGTHGATVNRFIWMWKEYPFAQDEVLAHRTSLSFVDSVWEIFGSLLAGVPVAVISTEDGRDPERLLRACREARVTRITVVPSLLRAFLLVCPQLSKALPTARLWITSGERLTRPLYEQFRAAAPDAMLLNLYGSTEVAGDVTCAALGPDVKLSGDIPIGRPIMNARTLILDHDLNPVKNGETGGLYIGGPVMARGYHRRPDENRARFLADPTLLGEKIFWTGDLVRIGPSADLYYVGRADNQIKVRGVRIEPEEIEFALSTYRVPVAAAAVVLRQSDDVPEGRLVAFVTPATLEVDDLRRHAATILPAHMVPAWIEAVAELPLTPNGKIDRRLLSLAKAGRTARVPDDLLPQTPTEKTIADIWARLLATWPIGRNDNFFDLGGDSLSVVSFLVELRQRFGLKEQWGDFAQALTLEAAARWIDEQRCGRTLPPKSETGDVEIMPMAERHVGATALLAAEVFIDREPLAVCAGLSREQFLPFCQTVAQACAASRLSFVAVHRNGGVTGPLENQRVVGFCLAHDLAVALDVEIPPRLAPVMALLDELGQQYRHHVGHAAAPGEIMELFMAGAARDIDGFTTVVLLEQAALAAARKQGFSRAVSICTSKVTAHIALEESRFERLAATSYESFHFEGRAVFAAAAGVHHQAVLVEKHLR